MAEQPRTFFYVSVMPDAVTEPFMQSMQPNMDRVAQSLDILGAGKSCFVLNT